ncbi:hypothetical protein GmHk_15G044752 [Glycine max]|nr:hypothetical protein GmHk_15G044752 [Glycine max]
MSPVITTLAFCKGRGAFHTRSLQSKFDRCFTRPSTFLIQTYIFVVISFSAFPNSSQKFAKPFQKLCFSMATSLKETSSPGSPTVPSSPSSTPNVSVPDAEKDVPTSSTPNAEALPSPSEEGSTEEEDQATEKTPAPRAPEPAPGDLIDLEEVESDEEPIANRLAPGIAERLQSRKGKTPIKRSGRIKTMAQKKSTPITPTTSRRSKVAIPSKKRKEISSSDSDDDVELDVSTSKRAKKSGKKVPENVPDAPLDNISFHSIGNAERWKFVYQRRLALERELGRDALDCKEIMDLIKAAGLLKTVTKLGDCYESLVREFIVNIPSDITNRKSDEYQKVFVRGKCVRFSPAVINKYLDRPTDGVVDIAVSEHQIAKEITAKQVQHWPKKGKLSAGKLSVKYAILHRIGAANWVPTNHTSTVATGLGKFLYAVGTKSKFNFGNYIFDQTVKHSESFAVKLPIAFPTVLCGIMLSQHPNILNNIDSVMKRESPLSLHYKLFEGTHVPDIVSTSGKAAASSAVSKDDLIAELKDTCKVLEATIKANTEKKMELERLIRRLSESGIDDGYVPSSFADLVFAGERIEVGLRRGKFDYAATASSSNRRAGMSRGNKPPLNQPQNPPVVYPRPKTTPNTNQNINQGRNFQKKKPIEFTSIPISYADLLPYLLDNAMVVVSPSKIPQPPFPRGYNSNVTCAYHGGVPRHSIEYCMTLKHKVQSLIDAGWLRFDEENHL